LTARGYQVVAACATVVDTFRQVRELRPRLVCTDGDLPRITLRELYDLLSPFGVTLALLTSRTDPSAPVAPARALRPRWRWPGRRRPRGTDAPTWRMWWPGARDGNPPGSDDDPPDDN
jgi:hypothetical protein